MQVNSSWLQIVALYLGTWLVVTALITVGQFLYRLKGQKGLLWDKEKKEYIKAKSKPSKDDLLSFGQIVLLAGGMSLAVLFFH